MLICFLTAGMNNNEKRESRSNYSTPRLINNSHALSVENVQVMFMLCFQFVLEACQGFRLLFAVANLAGCGNSKKFLSL